MFEGFAEGLSLEELSVGEPLEEWVHGGDVGGRAGIGCCPSECDEVAAGGGGEVFDVGHGLRRRPGAAIEDGTRRAGMANLFRAFRPVALA